MVNLHVQEYTEVWSQCIHIGILLIGLVLINSKGADGQIGVVIQSENLDYNEASNIQVSIDSTEVVRVTWRNSSVDVTILPTSDESVLVQNSLGTITCPGGCDRFTMTTDYALVFNRVEIADSKQKFWCDANAGDGNGFDRIVPNVCKNGEFKLELKDEKLICNVIGYYPDTDFTLVWKDPNEIEQPSEEDCVTKPTDDGFFERTCTLDPSSSGTYTCQAGGNCAFDFAPENFQTIEYTVDAEEYTTGEKWGIGIGVVCGCGLCAVGYKKYKDKE